VDQDTGQANQLSECEAEMSESICKQVQKLQQSHAELLEALKSLTEAASHVAADSLFDPVDKAIAAIKNAEENNGYH